MMSTIDSTPIESLDMIRFIDPRLLRPLLATALLLLLPAFVSAQNTSDVTSLQSELWRIGGYAGAQVFAYNADMSGLPGVPSCCPRYQDGSGGGVVFGVATEIPVVSRLSAGVRFLFNTYSGELKAEERELVTSGRDTVTAVFGHTIRVSQPALGMDALFSYRAVAGLRVIAGAHADMMIGGTYHQSEEILAPGDIRFENDSRQRGLYDGDLPNETRVHVAVMGGLRYDLPMNRDKNLLLVPEIDLWQGVNDLVRGESWKMRGIRAGISFYFIQPGARAPTPLEPGRL
ncbi:MAG: hypothetical protein JWQ98_3349 [Chlorobi bacterium]|nr:hypothetical protein [Chlorobiota bacterium]